MILAACLISLPVVQDTVSPEEIRRWVRQMGSERYDERDAAMERLVKVGEPVIPHLYDALEGRDLEIRARAVFLLRILQEAPIHAVLNRASALAKNWDASAESKKELEAKQKSCAKRVEEGRKTIEKEEEALRGRWRKNKPGIVAKLIDQFLSLEL